MNYIQQRDAALAQINSLIGPNGVGAITGTVHRDNERNQTNDAYANLLAYDGFTFSIVRNGATAAENGANLLAAYAAARTATPNGAAKSATNRFAILLPPAVYDLGPTTPLALDTQFVDIVGIGAPNNTVITSAITTANGGTVVKSANDVVVDSVLIQNTAANYVSGASTEASGYAPQGQYAAEIFRNVVFRNLSGVGGSSFIRRGQVFAGTYENCTGIDSSNTSVMFDGAVAGSKFINCRYTGPGFGYEIPFTGTVTRCEAGNNSFGYYSSYSAANVWSGTLKGCVGGSNSFGRGALASSTVIDDCTGGTFSFLYLGRSQGAVLTGCEGGDDSFFRQCEVASLRASDCTATNRAFCYLATVTAMTLNGCRGLASCFGYDAAYTSANITDIVYSGCSGTTGCFSRVQTIGAASDRARYINCTGGTGSFAYDRTVIEGVYTNCTGANECFAFALTVSVSDSVRARFVNCVGDRYCFFGTSSLFSGSVVVASTFIKCTAGYDSFGSSTGNATIDFSGIATDCTGGTTCFGASLGTVTFSGRAVNCNGANYCFASSPTIANFTGSATDCTAGAFSYGAVRAAGVLTTGIRSGNLTRCSCLPRFNAGAVGGGSSSPVTGDMYNCEWGYQVNVGDGSVIIGGTYVGSFVAAGAVGSTIDLIGHTGTIDGLITNTVVSPHITPIP